MDGRTTSANELRYYCLSLLDKHHNPNIELDEGLKLLEKCTDELKRRLPIDYKGVRFLHKPITYYSNLLIRYYRFWSRWSQRTEYK